MDLDDGRGEGGFSVRECLKVGNEARWYGIECLKIVEWNVRIFYWKKKIYHLPFSILPLVKRCFLRFGRRGGGVIMNKLIKISIWEYSIFTI